MSSNVSRAMMLAGIGVALFGVSTAVLIRLLPGPHTEKDYFIIGCMATLVSLSRGVPACDDDLDQDAESIFRQAGKRLAPIFRVMPHRLVNRHPLFLLSGHRVFASWRLRLDGATSACSFR